VAGPNREGRKMPSIPMDSVSDLLLLILYANTRQHGRSTLAGTTRLQKLLFLLTQTAAYEKLVDQRESPSVEFQPYRMGPFSASLYDAVELLANFNPPLISATPAQPGSPDQTELQRYIDEVDLDRSWPSGPRPATYSLSPEGKRLAEMLWGAAAPQLRDSVATTVKEFGAMPIRELLRHVYSEFPDMTERSEIKRELGLG